MEIADLVFDILGDAANGPVAFGVDPVRAVHHWNKMSVKELELGIGVC